VIAILIGGFSVNNTVSAFQKVIPGEQLLYEIDLIDRYEGDYQYWYEFEHDNYPYYETSRWNIYDDTYKQDAMMSYFITVADNVSTIVDEVGTYYYADGIVQVKIIVMIILIVIGN